MHQRNVSGPRSYTNIPYCTGRRRYTKRLVIAIAVREWTKRREKYEQKKKIRKPWIKRKPKYAFGAFLCNITNCNINTHDGTRQPTESPACFIEWELQHTNTSQMANMDLFLYLKFSGIPFNNNNFCYY